MFTPSTPLIRRLALTLLFGAAHLVLPSAGFAQDPAVPAQAPDGFAAAFTAGTPAVLAGELTIFYADDFARGRAERHYVVKDQRSGRSVEIRFEKPPIHLRTGAVVSVTGQLSGSVLYVASAASDSASAAPAAIETISAPVTTTTLDHRTLVMVANFRDASVTSSRATIDAEMFSDPAGLSVAALYKSSSLGQVSLSGDVVGPFLLNVASTDACDIGTWAQAADAQAASTGLNLSAYQHKVYVMPMTTCSAAGYGTIGGSPSYAWVFLSDVPGLYAHELGHNLGMDHAGTPTSEYDDGTDPMGFAAKQLRGVNAPHREEMGWLGAQAERTVTSAGTYDLAALALDPATVATPQVIKLAKPDTGDYYYLSYREPIAYDQYIDAWYYNRLSIHHYKGDGSASRTYMLGGLAEGEQFADAVNGVTIALVRHDSVSATVSIGLSCVPSAPFLILSPAVQSVAPGRTVTYTASLVNRDSGACPATTFALTPGAPSGWLASLSPATLIAAPAASVQATLTVTVPASALAGNASVGVAVDDGVQAVHSVTASATCSVADGAAPTAPSALKATVDQKRKQIQLSWAASTDNVGVAGYRVWKNGVQVGVSTTTAWTDTGYSSGSYFVTAYDGAGNVSAPSNTVTVTLSGGGKK